VEKSKDFGYPAIEKLCDKKTGQSRCDFDPTQAREKSFGDPFVESSEIMTPSTGDVPGILRLFFFRFRFLKAVISNLFFPVKTKQSSISDTVILKPKTPWSDAGRLQLVKGHTLLPDVIYVGRNRRLGGGLITDGVHWGNPFHLHSEISARAARYRGVEESGRDEYWALRDYFITAVGKFCHLVDHAPGIATANQAGSERSGADLPLS
jgi:hypothetical protein